VDREPRLSMACAWRYGDGNVHHEACSGWFISSGGEHERPFARVFCECPECRHDEKGKPE
jgi:hypothetical protein